MCASAVELTPGRREGRVLVIAAVMAALFVSAISQTAVATALPRLVGELGGLSLYPWVLTSSMLSATAVIPLVGKLSDRYGRKPFLMGGIVLFLIASALAGAAQDMLQLILFRAIQGLAGGTIMASAFATIGDLFPPAERGRYFGLFTGVFAVASVAGPLIGGFVTDHWGWRWVFYVTIPFGLLALPVLMKGTSWQRQTRSAAPIDWMGMVALLSAVVPLLLALAWASARFSWTSWQVGGLLAVCVLGTLIFLLVERGAADPVLPPSLFGNRTFAVASAVTLLTGISLFGALSYMPLFIQGVLGASATNSGLVNTPFMLGLTAASIGAGNLTSRTGRYRRTVLAGGAVLVGGMAVMVTLDEQASLLLPIAGMVVVGLGLGLSMPLLALAVQNALADHLTGVSTASSQFFRQIGGTLGIALFGTMITTRLHSELPSRLPAELTAAAPDQAARQLEEPRILLNPQALEQMRTTFANIGETGPALYDRTLEAMRGALASGLHDVFVIGLAIALLAMAISALLPELPLRAGEALAEEEQGVPPEDGSWLPEGRALDDVLVLGGPRRQSEAAATMPSVTLTGR